MPMNPTHPRARTRLRRTQLAVAGTAVLTALALIAGPAHASTGQVALIQDGGALNANPGGDISQFRALGGTTLRVTLQWYTVAPSASSSKMPKFSASNPGAYPAGNWTQWDNIIKDATASGMKVDLDIVGGPPRWAQGSGAPAPFSNYAKHYGYKVNAKDYGQFVQAVATRYDGRYKPKGASSALPGVKIWSLWNEPNSGEDLGPQNVDATAKSNGYNVAAGYYRSLLRTGYSALLRTGKGKTILLGEFAGQGRYLVKTRKFPEGLPGLIAIASPQSYIETLYCLTAQDKPLSGTAATLAGCPTTAAARGSFVQDNPALFDATAVAMHPYASQFAPNVSTKTVPASDIILPVIGRLTSEMTAVTRAWHHTRNYNVWSTEYGFVTSPPFKNNASTHYPSATTAATYLNEAEYLSYENPRVSTYAQYLLQDPAVVKGVGLFSSGLLTSSGKQKPGYDAYRLPLWLPSQTAKKGASTYVWGGPPPAGVAPPPGGPPPPPGGYPRGGPPARRCSPPSSVAPPVRRRFSCGRAAVGRRSRRSP